MLGVLLDAGVMYGVIAMVSGETPEFLTALLVAIGFALAMGACMFLGLAGAIIAIVPLVVLFGALLSFLFGMPLSRAILGSGIFLVYKIVMVVTWTMMFS